MVILQRGLPVRGYSMWCLLLDLRRNLNSLPRARIAAWSETRLSQINFNFLKKIETVDCKMYTEDMP